MAVFVSAMYPQRILLAVIAITAITIHFVHVKCFTQTQSINYGDACSHNSASHFGDCPQDAPRSVDFEKGPEQRVMS